MTSREEIIRLSYHNKLLRQYAKNLEDSIRYSTAQPPSSYRPCNLTPDLTLSPGLDWQDLVE